MKLAHIDIGKLSVSAANMRHGRKPPDIADILPSIRARGVLMPLLVRPATAEGDDHFEIVAGRRRYHAALAVADEAGQGEALPCAIIEPGDDAAALEASLIENIARLDPDEVTQWETFTRLVKEGRTFEDVSATFGLTGQQVKRVLALGNLLPRLRDLYRKDEIDAATIRHLTLASKTRQKEWLGLFDDPETYAPRGSQVKAWLFGGASIPAKVALFDLVAYPGKIVTDLFGDEGYFDDAEAFWTLQNAAIEARKAACLEEGWSDVIVLDPGDYFHSWEYEKTPKRKGGRVYVEVRHSGEVTFHEGYLSRKEARRRTGLDGDAPSKPVRPEITNPMRTYLDLHRHAAVRAALTGHPGVALRLMAAHAIAGSALWSVCPEPQVSRSDGIDASLAGCASEAAFAARRRAVLDVLGHSGDEPTLSGGNGDDYHLTALFLRLLDLSDAAVLDVVAVVMGETLAADSAVIEALGPRIGVDMAASWQPDGAFFDLIRDREVLTRMLADVAGDAVAKGNANEKAKTLKGIIRDHLTGENGRPKMAAWVPRWMAFPPAAYTERGGVATVERHARIADLVSPEGDARSSEDAEVQHPQAA
jgi:ParB family chromosome partitioning protein